MAAHSGHRPIHSIHYGESHPPALACYNLADSETYLRRLSLDSSLTCQPPSLELLSSLTLAHHLSVPYDTTPLHVLPEEWAELPSKRINFRRDLKMGLGKENFKRIVTRASGGYCFTNNTAFAALLRGWGYRVSECGARIYSYRNKDPVEVGYDWSQIIHAILVVDWEGSEGRYLVDVGFGAGASPFPILLKDGRAQRSVSPVESFILRSETLPRNLNDVSYPDVLPGFTCYGGSYPKE